MSVFLYAAHFHILFIIIIDKIIRFFICCKEKTFNTVSDQIKYNQITSSLSLELTHYTVIVVCEED